MRIGVMVGKTPKGKLEYIGQPGEISVLDKLQRKITDGRSGKYVQTWIGDVGRRYLKRKKCTMPESEAAKVTSLAEMSKKELLALIKAEVLEIEPKGNKTKIVAAIEAARAAKAAAEKEKAEPEEEPNGKGK